MSTGVRITFEASGPRRAVDVASELLWLTGAFAVIHAVVPLSGRGGDEDGHRTCTVDVVVPDLSLGPEVQVMERKLLSLEYRLPGTRFLGWTTTAIPAIAERTGLAGRERPADDWRPPSQRDLVAESLRYRPETKGLDDAPGGRAAVEAVRPRF